MFDVPLDELQQRTSAKWRTFPPDVLPLHVAEMDVRLAPAVMRSLRAAVEASDTGYSGTHEDVVASFARFAERRWDWQVQADLVRVCADVAVGVTEVLRRLVAPGDRVVVTTPVYPPFWAWLRALGAEAAEVPLRADDGWRLDLDGIAAALASGARAVLLCSPHNPTGRVHDPDELRALAALAEAAGATVVSDEIWSPLALPGATHTPYVTVSPEAARTGVVVTSASKGWNLAGLKCAVIAVAPGGPDVLHQLPHEIRWGAGQLGVLATAAAYDDGQRWLDELLLGLDAKARLLTDLLAEHLPGVRTHRPQAGYLAWLDCRGLGLGDDPAAVFLERSRVGLSPGPDFGPQGRGFARLNLATHDDVLREAVRRMGTVLT